MLMLRLKRIVCFLFSCLIVGWMRVFCMMMVMMLMRVRVSLFVVLF